jgi:hypothetical protein
MAAPRLIVVELRQYPPAMRYLMQFLVPALILVTVVYLLGRTRRAGDQEPGQSDTGTFILILVVGAAVAVLSFFVLQAVLD